MPRDLARTAVQGKRLRCPWLANVRSQVELIFEEDRDLPAVKADPLGLHAALSQLLLNVTLGLDPGARLGITLRRFGEGAQAVIRGLWK